MALRWIVLAVVLGGMVALGPALVAQSTDYDISGTNSVPVPQRTVDVQGNTFTIDSTIRADPGDRITVGVSAPPEVYRVYVYNSDEQIVASDRGNGSGSFDFDLSGYPAGSYAVTVNPRDTGTNDAIQPLLVRGYETSISVPNTASGQFTVDISVSPTAASGEPHLVRAVVADEGAALSAAASGSNGEYTATLDASSLSPGTYTVFGFVQGQTQAFGRNELMGLSNGASVTVEAPPDTQTPTPTEASGGGGGGGGEEATDATDEPTATPTEAVDDTPTPDDGTDSPTSTDRPTTNPTPTPTDRSVVTPAAGTDTATPTDGGTGPGFGLLAPAVILLLYGVARTRSD